jgi:hypothetical protein
MYYFSGSPYPNIAEPHTSQEHFGDTKENHILKQECNSERERAVRKYNQRMREQKICRKSGIYSTVEKEHKYFPSFPSFALWSFWQAQYGCQDVRMVSGLR